MKRRVYVDTSVIGGCEDEEFSYYSKLLFHEFQRGLKIAVVSDLTWEELKGAPEKVKRVLSTIPTANIEEVHLTEEARELAEKYIRDEVVTAKHIVDAQHIAIASVERVDVLASWNFRQIVNLDCIYAFNAVNLKMGYPMLEIRSPQEVIHEKKI